LFEPARVRAAAGAAPLETGPTYCEPKERQHANVNSSGFSRRGETTDISFVEVIDVWNGQPVAGKVAARNLLDTGSGRRSIDPNFSKSTEGQAGKPPPKLEPTRALGAASAALTSAETPIAYRHS
jgi:hypothetical protein